jgi:hypothetical protein
MLHVMLRWTMITLGCLWVACGSGGDGGDRRDAGVDGDAAAACGRVGAPCAADCADQLRCYESAEGSFCAPDRAHCGGFAGADCEEEAHVCMVLSGDTLGVCLTTEERACVCGRSPGAVDGC